MQHQKEKVVIRYSPTYNTQVEYYGTRDEIRQFFRVLDIWGSWGLLKKNNDEQYYLFELPNEFYLFAMSDSFMYAMRRHNIDLILGGKR